MDNYRWLPERGTRIHIVDKDTGEIVRRPMRAAAFLFPPCQRL